MGGWEEKPRDVDLTILYICGCIGIGAIVRCLLKNLSIGNLKFSYSSPLIIFGILYGLLTIISTIFLRAPGFILKMEPFDLIAIVFPPFIFKTAFQTDNHIFLKSLGQILTISTLGFSFSYIIVGFFMFFLMGRNWSIQDAILFGLIASLTDSKDTSKFLGQFKNLGVLLIGEEMIISSISVFLYDVLVHPEDGPLKADPAYIALFKIVASVATGFIIGKLFVYFVSWNRCDFYTNISISFFVSYTMLYSVKIFLGVSGILSLLVFGVIVCCNKQQIAVELERSLVKFWEFLYNLLNFVLYIEAGILLVHASQSHGEGSDIVRIIMAYIMCLITRFLMILILSPILTRIGYGLEWKNGIVLVWGALKGSATILLASCIYLDSQILGDFSHKAIIYGVGLVLMQLIINGTTLKPLVHFLGFTAASIIKISNMDNIMSYVMSAREKSINMLRINRFFADAAWDKVKIATKITHPYKDSSKEDGNFSKEVDKINGHSKCPDCEKEISIEPSYKELQEIKKEVYLKILKAQKVSYWRQFEWGLLTKEANRTLVGAVEDALEKNSNFVDIEALKNNWKPRGCIIYFRNTLVKMMPKEYPVSNLKAPLERWKLNAYKTATSLWWECAIFLLVTLHVISIILDFVYRPKNVSYGESFLVSFSTVLFALLFIQIIVTVIGVECYSFMKSIWHLIDMLILVISFFYLHFVYKYFLTSSKSNMTLNILLILSGLRGVYILRFWRIFHVVRASIPKIVEHFDRKIDIQLAHGYDVGKGFVTGEIEILKLLPRFVKDRRILEEIKNKMEADRLAITKEIGILQRYRPKIAITVKTREGMAAVLHIMTVTAKELKDGGLLDEVEFSLLMKAIHERQKFIQKKYLTISPCPPDILFRQIAWLINDEGTASFLMTHTLLVNLNHEEILIKTDEEPQGIYIIVSGLLRMTYIPNFEKLKKLEMCGALPNVDYPVVTAYRETQEDYIVPGNAIGEIGILTGRSYDATITCESAVQAYFISIDVINYAIKSQSHSISGLEQRMWKVVSVRLACILLPTVPAYQSWSQEKIQIYLEPAFIAKLNTGKTFMLSDAMETVLLIEGRALDVVNKEVYFAPTYIPRTVRRLTFTNHRANLEYNVEPILLIVPAEAVDEQELMNFVDRDLELSNINSIIWIKNGFLPEERFQGKLVKGGLKAVRASLDSQEEPFDVEPSREPEVDITRIKYDLPESEEQTNGTEFHYNENFEGEIDETKEVKMLKPEERDKGSVSSNLSKESLENAYLLSYFNYKSLLDWSQDNLLKSNIEILTEQRVIDEQYEKDKSLVRKIKKKAGKRSKDVSRKNTSQNDLGNQMDTPERNDPQEGTSKSPDQNEH